MPDSPADQTPGAPVLRIGLTGGIGSGKSTVAELFARHGITVIDADDIVRRLSSRGQPAYQAIIDHFGGDILGDDREIDRRGLRVRVFNNPDERSKLESILHPLVRQAIEDDVARLTVPYCIISIPLLIEAGLGDMVDRILVVDADEQLRIKRVMDRNGMDEDEVRKILASQTSRAERLRHAHDCIVNDTDLRHLENAVEQLHRSYIALAAAGATRPR